MSNQATAVEEESSKHHRSHDSKAAHAAKSSKNEEKVGKLLNNESTYTNHLNTGLDWCSNAHFVKNHANTGQSGQVCVWLLENRTRNSQKCKNQTKNASSQIVVQPFKYRTLKSLDLGFFVLF